MPAAHRWLVGTSSRNFTWEQIERNEHLGVPKACPISYHYIDSWLVGGVFFGMNKNWQLDKHIFATGFKATARLDILILCLMLFNLFMGYVDFCCWKLYVIFMASANTEQSLRSYGRILSVEVGKRIKHGGDRTDIERVRTNEVTVGISPETLGINQLYPVVGSTSTWVFFLTQIAS